ncbi:MAG: 1-deoxy-D-xylulose-5-phosphate synthase [Chlorobiales bacterium]|nr:1-deoxy-D-xylulose-5-phosphate synthase [Chlorobiales bacterium]
MHPNLKESEELANFGDLLRRINTPDDLKKFSIDDLPKIAEECRDLVIDVVSKHGGHFGASLGAADLSVALHYVYDTPRDQIIWDVGHQAYVHKILTGRKKYFYSNRTYGGVAGFPKRSESVYDTFGVGHASTSISAAVGMALARDLKKEKFKVAAVIGDGSMTGGMAFEAMNHLGHLKTDVTVILNDNCMSIDPNVGGLRDYLTNITTNSTYNKLRRDIWEAMSKLDNEIGHTARKILRGVEGGLKAALTPGAFFEALGFRYFGPIDGHDVKLLAKALREIRALPHPKLLHIVTVKGKGYELAEKDQLKWHAQSGAFNKTTGEALKKPDPAAPPQYQEVFGQAITELARMDSRVVGITAAMPSGTSLKVLGENLPERFFDVGIAEQHAVTFAAGLATQGLRPVCAIYSTFLQRAYDQIIHDVALQKLNVIFAMDRAGLVGADGPTHHGSFDISYLRLIPDIVIMAPMNEQELRDMLYTATQYDKGPTAIRYPRGNATGMTVRKEFQKVEIGKGEILRDGEEVAILGIGVITKNAMDAAKLLEAQGISPLVANMRFAKPIDTELLDAICERFDRIVTIEENAIRGGFGSAVCEYLQEKGYRNRVLMLGIPDRFIDHGSPAELHKEIGLDPQSIVKSIVELAGCEDVVGLK